MTYIKQNNKKELIINIAGTAVLLMLLLVGSTVNQKAAETQNSGQFKTSHQTQIADEVLRFHVIANSDSEEDQNLKLKVKEAVLEALRPKLANAKSAKEAGKIISYNIEEMEEVADAVIEEAGYSYKSKGVLGKTTFPVKQYGDMVFPAGEYEAFRILLGEAEGKNWWCVMFPSLCYVDEAYDVITEENKEQFKEILTKEEYESLFMENTRKENQGDDAEEDAKDDTNERAQDTKIFYKLKSTVWMNMLIDYFSK